MAQLLSRDENDSRRSVDEAGPVCDCATNEDSQLGWLTGCVRAALAEGRGERAFL